MFIESDDYRHRAVLPRIGDGLADDLLVTEMDAIKHPNGGAEFTIRALQLTGFGNSYQCINKFVGKMVQIREGIKR